MLQELLAPPRVVPLAADPPFPRIIHTLMSHSCGAPPFFFRVYPCLFVSSHERGWKAWCVGGRRNKGEKERDRWRLRWQHAMRSFFFKGCRGMPSISRCHGVLFSIFVHIKRVTRAHTQPAHHVDTLCGQRKPDSEYAWRDKTACLPQDLIVTTLHAFKRQNTALFYS